MLRLRESKPALTPEEAEMPEATVSEDDAQQGAGDRADRGDFNVGAKIVRLWLVHGVDAHYRTALGRKRRGSGRHRVNDAAGGNLTGGERPSQHVLDSEV